MRRLVLQMNMSVDGFVGRINGSLDWMLPETDERQIVFLKELTKNIGTILLGRKMATEAIPHWDKIAKSDKESAEVEFAKFFTAASKVVFSKTLTHIEGENVSVENGDLSQKVKSLKVIPGKDIIVYGGAGFVSSLVNNKLIDELNLSVHPVSLGAGLAIFNKEQKYHLAKCECYNNGVVLKQYTIQNSR